jgi:hypothetical protein
VINEQNLKYIDFSGMGGLQEKNEKKNPVALKTLPLPITIFN